VAPVHIASVAQHAAAKDSFFIAYPQSDPSMPSPDTKSIGCRKRESHAEGTRAAERSSIVANQGQTIWRKASHHCGFADRTLARGE
jgi:hypothetical protein